MIRYEYVLQEISKKFIFGINYTSDDGERWFGLATASPKFAPPSTVSKIKDEEITHHILWDMLTGKELSIPINDISFAFRFLHSLKINDVDMLLTISDENKIADYNKKVIEFYKERDKGIFKIRDELLEEYDISFTEKEMQYYRSTFNTHYFTDLKNDDTYLLKLCMLLKTKPTTLIKEEVSEEELKVSRDIWMEVIKKYIIDAKVHLEEELDKMDKSNPEYEFEKEEVDIIKGLLDDIPSQFIEELEECKNYKELLETWPPLLLPAPQFIIDEHSGRNAFERILTCLETKYINE